MQVQYPPPSKTSPGLIVGLILGSGLLGAVCGGGFTYLGMTAYRVATSSGGNVPVSKGFAQPKMAPLANGWWKYTFSDLDMSVELPAVAGSTRRSFPPGERLEIIETADYTGGGNATGYQLGAYWDRHPERSDPTALAKYNMSLKPVQEDLKYTLNQTVVDGCPACTVMGTYRTEGKAASFHIIYIQRGNGLYYLQSRFWQDSKDGETEWQRMLHSVHFLDQRPLNRS